MLSKTQSKRSQLNPHLQFKQTKSHYISLNLRIKFPKLLLFLVFNVRNNTFLRNIRFGVKVMVWNVFKQALEGRLSLIIRGGLWAARKHYFWAIKIKQNNLEICSDLLEEYFDCTK
jgi:hypothetical protein